MEFLNNTLKLRPSSSNISNTEEISEEIEEISSPTRAETQPSSSDIHKSVISPETIRILPRRKLKFHHEVNDVEKLINFLENKKNPARQYRPFFLSYEEF